MTDRRKAEYEILRGLSPEQKLATMEALIRQAFDLKIAWVRATEPMLGDDEVWAKARELVVGGQP